MHEDAVNEQLCFWHDQSETKNSPDPKEKREERARTGRPMEYFKLAHTDLNDINLVNSGQSEGYKLTHADLYRSNLQNAHLFGADLSFSSLMKADLRGANLHLANLKHANLLGVRLYDAKLEGVQWGEIVLQESQAMRTKDAKERRQLYSEAEEIYRCIGREMRNQGMVGEIGWFFYREMVTRRKQLRKYSIRRAFSKFIDIYCGYGEKPLRLITISGTAILSFALLYATVGLQSDGTIQNLSAATGLSHTVTVLLNALYFSVVTFTTLGYGDFTPIGRHESLRQWKP